MSALFERSIPFVLFTVVISCDDGRFTRYSKRLAATTEAGTPAPAYEGRTLEGPTISLSGLKGRVVLLNAWATWCKPCIAELPVLEKLHERYRHRGLTVIGISVDDGDPESLIEFLAERGVTYTNLQDDDWRLGKAFGWPFGVPRSVLIDRDGVVAAYWIGAIRSDDTRRLHEVVDTIEALLTKRPSR